MEGTYTVNFNCDNCRRSILLTFKKGEKASLAGPCPHCGVTGGTTTERGPVVVPTKPFGNKEILLENQFTIK